MSLKEGERMRRAASGIDIIGMNKDTPIPQQLDKFWASEKNKRNLQLLVKDMLLIRRSTLGDCAFPVAAARVWNSLPSSLRAVQSLTTFRYSLKPELFEPSFT